MKQILLMVLLLAPFVHVLAQPPVGFVRPSAFVAQKADGTWAFLDVDGSGNLAAANSTVTVTGGQTPPVGYVVPYALVAQDPGGLWVFLKVNSSGQLSTTGSGSGGGGGVSYCAPASASGTTYTCTASPAVTSYTTGVTLAFVPDVAGSGGATTVNANGLGAKSVVLGDGSTNPTARDFQVGTLYTLVYDGTKFRKNSARFSPVTMVWACFFSTTASGIGMLLRGFARRFPPPVRVFLLQALALR